MELMREATESVMPAILAVGLCWLGLVFGLWVGSSGGGEVCLDGVVKVRGCEDGYG